MVFILFLDKKSSLNMIKFYHIFYVTESPISVNIKVRGSFLYWDIVFNNQCSMLNIHPIINFLIQRFLHKVEMTEGEVEMTNLTICHCEEVWYSERLCQSRIRLLRSTSQRQKI